MGTWGIDIFDNDAAMDWLYSFRNHPTKEELNSTLENIINNNTYIELDDGAAALAAAEIIAAIKGKKSNSYPEDLKIFSDLPVTEALTNNAIKAIDIICESEESELRQLWKETEYFDNWMGTIIELKNRLQ